MRNTATKILLLSILIIGSAIGVFAQGGKLANAEWKLIEAYGQAANRSTAFIDFGDDLTRFTGNAGCNRMFGTVTVRGNRLTFSGIGTTRMMCKMMAGSIPEETVLRGMNATVRYRFDRERLSFIDRRGRTVLKFRKLVKGPGNGDGTIQLEDKKWVLESVKGRKTLVALPYAFINFDAKKGSAGGDTSCNLFGGDYKANRNSITFSDIISTMRACIEDNKMFVERDMLDGLRRANRFEIRDNRLDLYRSNELLLTFRGENK